MIQFDPDNLTRQRDWLKLTLRGSTPLVLISDDVLDKIIIDILTHAHTDFIMSEQNKDEQ